MLLLPYLRIIKLNDFNINNQIISFMKKLLIAAALLVGGASVASAEGYNRVAVSYDLSTLSFNKDASYWEDKSESVGLNGFGINYIHGFGVAENMFVEAGANLDFLFGSKGEKETDDDVYWDEDKTKFQNINIQVPVNFVYRFNVAEGVSIDTYVGLNFKFHFTNKYKEEYTCSDSEYNESGEWINLFNDDEKNMGDKDATWNRFQMGWHVGVGCNYQRYYLGVQFGTDFIPAYSHNYGEGYEPKVNTSNLKVSLGYTF